MVKHTFCFILGTLSTTGADSPGEFESFIPLNYNISVEVICFTNIFCIPNLKIKMTRIRCSNKRGQNSIIAESYTATEIN